MKKIFLLIILLSACKTPTIPEDKNITTDDIYAHISFLSNDHMEGRKAGSIFEQRSASYVKKCFETYGLEPIGESYYQEFQFAAGISIGENNVIILNDRISNSEFTTLSFSASDQVNAPVVFAGYGISAPDLDYDDYKNLDVSGKIVMILRFSPDGEKKNGEFARYAPLRYKAVTARENGAVGIIFVTGPSEDNNGDKLKTGGSLGGKQSVGIPAVHIKRKVVNEWLESLSIQSIDKLQEKINGHGHPQPSGFSINSTIQINTDIDVELQTSRNTVGAIPGNGELKDEWLILGAHIDHLGWGGEGSNSMAPDLHEIHNGADDNASGVSALLELAAYFTKEASKTESRRSILFIAFGAEEVGLLGSSYFVDNPMIPIENVVAMFNMDMVGRLTEDKLVIGGAGTSSAWEKLISDANSDSLIFTFDEQGFGSSDHQPFYLKGIPVLFFFTGAHEDYHRPTDDLEFLNIPGIMKVSNLIAGSTEYILTAFEKPDYINVQSKKQSDRGSYNVTFGVIPDFMYDGDGFRISGVRELAPAGLAGMQGGDIITSINGISILNIYDYMYALQNCTSGIEVPVVVKRGDEELILQIAPQSKSSD